MKLYYKLISLYQKYQLICWVTGLATGLMTPALGYGVYIVQFIKKNRGLEADNPELVSERVMANPVEFLTTSLGGILGILAKWILIIGLVIILLNILFYVLSLASNLATSKPQKSEETESESDDTDQTEADSEEPPIDLDSEEFLDDPEELDDYGQD